jgi:hypothetical protein
MSDELKTLQESIEEKKQRAAKFGDEYEPTEEEKKKLRELKFGKTQLNNKDNKALDKKTVAGKGKKRQSQGKKRRPAKRISVNLEDPNVQRRLARFGPPPEGTILSKAIGAADEEAKKAQRQERFESQNGSTE